MTIPPESERYQRFKSKTDHLPPLPNGGDSPIWCWKDEEIEMLRAACFRRFGETLRTESLFCIAATAIRIYLSRTPQLAQLEQTNAALRERELVAACNALFEHCGYVTGIKSMPDAVVFQGCRIEVTEVPQMAGLIAALKNLKQALQHTTTQPREDAV